MSKKMERLLEMRRKRYYDFSSSSPQIRHKSLDCIANWFQLFHSLDMDYDVFKSCLKPALESKKKLWNSPLTDIQKLITNKDKHQVIFCSMDLEIAFYKSVEVSDKM